MRQIGQLKQRYAPIIKSDCLNHDKNRYRAYVEKLKVRLGKVG